MGNRFAGGNGGAPIGTARSPLAWVPLLIICLALGILAIIAIVIVVSLISLYLPPKGGDLVAGNINNGTRMIAVLIAIDLVNGNAYKITNYDSISQQINRYLGYPTNTISVRSSYLDANAIVNTNTKKRKRQTSGQVSCDTDNKLATVIFINECPTTKCMNNNCFEKCVSQIKSRIQSKFGSSLSSLNILTEDGKALSISFQFCSFGQVGSGKGDKSGRTSLNRDDTDVNYEDRD